MPCSSSAGPGSCAWAATERKLGMEGFKAAEAAILAFCEGLPLALQLAGACMQGEATSADWEVSNWGSSWRKICMNASSRTMELGHASAP